MTAVVADQPESCLPESELIARKQPLKPVVCREEVAR